MRLLIFIKIFLIVFTLFLSPALRGSDYPPYVKWYTMETEHFFIHYPYRMSRVAKKIGIIAEDVYERLVPFMKWEPDRKVNVVLNDFVDMANGFTTFAPSNRIELYLVPPPLESQLNNYNDWLYLLFTHEFTHTLHIDQNSGLASLARYLFGRFYYSPLPILPSLPVVFFPSWIHESIAVYNETVFTGRGRGNSPYTDMVIFTALLEHNFPSLAQLITPPPSWPNGYIPYIFGEKFLEFLIKKHGLDSLYRSFKFERNYIFPLWEEILHFFAFHSLIEEDWDKWKRYLFRQAREKKLRVFRKGVKFISPPMWDHTSPVCMGGKVYYVEDSGYRERRLISYDPVTGKKKMLVRGYISPYLSPNGRYLFYSKLEFFKRYYLYSDLFVFDTLDNTEKRLTKGKRLTYPVSDGNFIYALKIDWRGVWIIKLNFRGTIIGRYKIPEADNAGFLVYDKFRHRLLFSAHVNGEVSLFAFDLKESKFDRLTRGGWIDLYPFIDSSGNIIFSSSRGGRGFNLFKLTEHGIRPLTMGLGGFFKGCIHGQNMFVDLYTSSGFRVAKIDFNKYTSRFRREGYENYENKVTSTGVSIKNFPDIIFPEKRYNPFSHLFPSAIFPEVSYSPVWKWRSSFEFEGGDPLNFINYDLRVEDKISLNLIDFSGWIVLKRFGPDFALGGGTLSIPSEMSNDTLKVSRKRFLTFQMQYSYPSMNEVSRYIILSYSNSVTDSSEGGARITFLYSTMRQYPEIWRLNDGFYTGITLFSFSPFLGSPYFTSGIIGDFKRYFSISPDILGRFELYGGVTVGDGRSDVRITPSENSYLSESFYYTIPTENSLNFYGYGAGEISGYTLGAISTAFDFRILRINDGAGSLPLWLGEVWTTLFSQHLVTSMKRNFSLPDKYYGNLGTSFNFNFVIGHLVPLYVKFVVTYRIPEGNSIESLYLSFSPF